MVPAHSAEENLQRLEHVFEKLYQAGLKLKPSKCRFLQKSVKFLGHVISANGVETDPSKTKCSLTGQFPRT